MAVDDGSRITASTAASGAAHHRILIPQIRPPLSSTKETQHNSTPTPAEQLQLQQHTTPHQTISPPHQPNPTQSKNTNDDEMTKRDGHRYRAEQAEAERSRERERGKGKETAGSTGLGSRSDPYQSILPSATRRAAAKPPKERKENNFFSLSPDTDARAYAAIRPSPRERPHHHHRHLSKFFLFTTHQD